MTLLGVGNIQSSKDNGLIRIDEFMGQILYTLYFMHTQGYDTEHNIML